jgi:hypothetical protein
MNVCTLYRSAQTYDSSGEQSDGDNTMALEIEERNRGEVRAKGLLKQKQTLRSALTSFQ